MRKFATALACAAMLAATPAVAPAKEPVIQVYDIAAVLENPELAAKLPPDVKFYFGNQAAPVVRIIGPLKTNRRTSNGKGPHISCQWAMTSALIALAEGAKRRGGNAIVGIKSNLGNNQTSSEHSYVCGLGGLMVNVALIGEVAVVE